ncbi:rhomboid family intramembrane serine protease [Gammaproteobacteria bacterium]|nr:rhomboid family intramembrane serine protease [Gammaproteobacteria bacterium]
MNTRSLYFYIILITVLLSFVTNFGFSSLLEPFLFLKNNGSSFYPSFENTFLVSMEWWRLITPTFLHFSLTHLIFNCLWIYILGSKIEIVDGKGIFLTLFLFVSLSSNLGQYFLTGDYLFGGLSGAVYGLLGYCFILDLDNRGKRYDLPNALYIFMFIWLLIGFTGVLEVFSFGNVANIAHLVGMIAGFILGIIAKYTLKI